MAGLMVALRRAAVMAAFLFLAQAPLGLAGPGFAGSAKPSAAAAAPAAKEDAEEPASEPAQPAAPAEQQTGEAEKPADTTPAEIEQPLQQIAKAGIDLDDIQKQVEETKPGDEALASARVALTGLQGTIRKAQDQLRPRLDAIKSQIEKLGPAPGKDAPAEAPEVASDRSRLNALLARIDGGMKSSELAQVRAAQLIQRVRELRQSEFARQIMHRVLRHPLSPKALDDLVRDIGEISPQVDRAALAWWAGAKPHQLRLFLMGLAAVAAYFALKRLRRRFVWVPLNQNEPATPPFATRAVRAGVVAVATALPWLASVGIVALALDQLDLLYREGGRIIKAALAAALMVVLVVAAVRAVLQPYRERWRLLDLSTPVARRLEAMIGGIAVVFAADRVADTAARELSLSLTVTVAEAFVASLLTAALLFGLAWTRLTPKVVEPDAPPVSRWRPRWLKLPLLVLALAIAGTTLAGFVALGQFLATQTLLTGAAIGALGLVHLAIRALTCDASEGGVLESAIDGFLGLNKERGRQVTGALGALLHAVALLAGIPLLMLSLGMPADEVGGHVKSALFGFEIGHFRISLARLLIAAAIFLGLAFATRLLQRWLTATVLGPSRMDTGIANSIETGVGYAGFVIASLISVSYAGFDVTNLAIVAGALSVGIGFGLQSIVNNFVSGLILLVERPVKVGDWIVAKGVEGYVRRISVRSTEIETFDRASVILPNSDLISGAVTNWTHRNALGRIKIKVRVSYSADPDQVLAVLSDVAKANPNILQYPEPVVTLDNLSPEGLEMSLRVLVADITKSLKAQTSLRADIVKAFRAAGIPHPAVTAKAAPSAKARVRVRVPLKADPERVSEVLTAAVEGVPGLTADPAPQVSLDDIGEDALVMSVEASLAEGAEAAAAESALRFAVVKALGRAGIEIAVGQRDIHIRDLDIVRGFLARAAEERMKKAAVEPVSSPSPVGPEKAD